ncbi:HEAT repeat domain-containing protein [Candidatus Omnitrophota bacterium]
MAKIIDIHELITVVLDYKEDLSVREEAAIALSNVQDPLVVETFIKILENKRGDSLLKREAIEALGKLRNPDATNILVVYLKDKDARLSTMAVNALGMIKNQKAVDPLIQVLKEKRTNKAAAAYVLGELGDLKAVEPLIESLMQKSSELRQNAILSLKKLRDKRAIEPLLQIVKNDFYNYNVRIKAVLALGEMGGQESVEVLEDILTRRKGKYLKKYITRALRNLKNKNINNIDENYMLSDSYGGVKELEREFFKEIMPIIQENPGINQPEMLKKGFDASTFWCLEKMRLIRREKFGRSYKLFLKIQNERSIKIRKSLLGEKVSIDVEGYPDSMKLICKYFGNDLLKEIFKISGNMITGIFDDNFEHFCYSIGACLKFDMNNSLKEIIDTYWNWECDEELKRFYLKYGFFSSRAFVQYKLEQIIGRDRLIDFYAELEYKALSFEIKWCGSWWTHINARHIPWDYAQHLKFKWGMKPDLIIKRCDECGESFYPFDYIDNLGIFVKVRKIPIQNSIAEINFCPKHLP